HASNKINTLHAIPGRGFDVAVGALVRGNRQFVRGRDETGLDARERGALVLFLDDVVTLVNRVGDVASYGLRDLAGRARVFEVAYARAAKIVKQRRRALRLLALGVLDRLAQPGCDAGAVPHLAEVAYRLPAAVKYQVANAR